VERLEGKAARMECSSKIMKLFLFNPDQVFDNAEISERTKTNTTVLRKELNSLEK